MLQSKQSYQFDTLRLTHVVVKVVSGFRFECFSSFHEKLKWLKMKDKNALSSVESRALGVKPPELLYYFFVWNAKRVLYVIMYILEKYKKLQGETGRTS